MQILTTQAALRAAIHKPGQGLAWQCAECGKVEELGTRGGCDTGYGYDAADRPICYECCGKQDLARMIETGRAVLYLTHDPIEWGAANGKVANWPGSLSLSGRVTRGRHNIARTRYDIWFKGPDGAQWHGVQYGENTQICHCRRTKA